MLSPLLLGLAATATFLALAVAGILAALYRKHSNGRPGSPKHAPIVCDPPNTGATTPVHPQTKQAVDDIDPDIIPNEYGEYTTFRLFETMVPSHDLRARDCKDEYTLGIYFRNFRKLSMEIKWIVNNLKWVLIDFWWILKGKINKRVNAACLLNYEQNLSSRWCKMMIEWDRKGS